MRSDEALRAYVGLGSNAAGAAEHLEQALAALAALPDMRLGAVSSVYATEPQDYADQPWFLNRAAELLPGADWEPHTLMDALLQIEAAQGRVRSPDPALRYGPRVIDLDLLLFGDVQSTHPHCLLPHPRLTRRAFVLVPLLEVAPQIRICGLPGRQWLARLPWRLEGHRIFQ